MRNLISIASLLLVSAGVFASPLVAFADLASYPDQVTMRCGPADTPIVVSLSGSLTSVMSCQESDSGTVYKQLSPLFVTVGSNRYEAKLMDGSWQLTRGCDYLGNILAFTLKDDVRSYYLHLSIKGQVSYIAQGTSHLCEGSR